MQSLEIYRTLARYNHWMNGKLFAVCAEISDETRKADLKAPFRSIHGTWNHLLLCDWMWLGRFRGEIFPARSLDQELFADFDELRQNREKTDADIENYIAGLQESDLESVLRFTPLSIPTPMETPFGRTLLHFFNHQTHHRGQITTLIEQVGADCGVTDLLRMPDEF